MKKRINISEIIKKNPNIDKNLFEESQNFLKSSAKIKSRSGSYNLVIPFSRSVTTINDNIQLEKK